MTKILKSLSPHAGKTLVCSQVGNAVVEKYYLTLTNVEFGNILDQARADGADLQHLENPLHD